jgi:hypothetical protein
MTASFVERIEFGKTNSIMLYQGINGLGWKFFAYIVCGLEGYKKLQQDAQNKATTNINSYGEIIYTDFLPEPDEKAQAFLKQWLKENDGYATSDA